MNHETHHYIAVTFSPSSPFLNSPATLVGIHPNLSLTYQGQVGELSDTHLYSTPKEEWQRRAGSAGQAEEILVRDLEGSDGVVHIEVQAPRHRVRRGGDEL